MSIKRFMMPLDYTGELQSNRVSGEVHELAKTNFKLVVPYSGYFYTHNFKIYDEASNPLERGTHFEFVYANEEVQMRTAGLEVVGALILRPNVKSDTVRLHYNQVGGPYANYTRAIEQALQDLDLDGRTVDFANLRNVPEYFTAGPHVEDIGNVFGFEYLRLGLDRIRDTLERSGATTSQQVAGLLGDLIDSINLMFQTHASDPKAHHTTANDVGAYSKDEIERIKADLESSIDQVKESIDSLNSGSGALEEKMQACLTAVRHVSRRMTIIDNLAKNAIRRFGGGAVVSGGGGGGEGGVSLGDVQKMISEVTAMFDDYLLKSAVAFNAKTNAALLTKIPVIDKDGILHLATHVDYHAKDSDADYDIRQTVQYNEDMGGMELFFTGYLNCIDVHQRSDARDKEFVGKLTPKRARQIIEYMGPAALFKFIGTDAVTAGVIAQKLQRVFPEAVGETVINEEGEKRLVIKPSAIMALLMTAMYGIYTE